MMFARLFKASSVRQTCLGLSRTRRCSSEAAVLVPRPGNVPLEIAAGTRVLLISESNNNMTRRIQYELIKHKSTCRTEILNRPELMIQAVESFQPDMIICPYMKMFVPESIYQVKGRPCLIIHPGIAGDRGASSIDWALLTGQKEWGVTVLEASEVFDGGDIWSTEYFEVPKHSTKTSLYNGDITDAGARCAVDAVSRFCQGMQMFSSSANTTDICGTFQRNMKNADRKISWEASSLEVVSRIRMSDTVPGAIAEFVLPSPDAEPTGETAQRFRVFDGHIEDGSSSETVRRLMQTSTPGEILATKDKSILVKTGDDYAVWIGQMKKITKKPALKLPATRLLPETVLRNLPTITEPCRHDSVTYTISGDVCTVSFDFYNGAMDTEQAGRLRDTIKAVAGMEDIKVVALIGGERFFSTGIHLCVIEDSQPVETEAYRNIVGIDDVIKETISMTTKATVAVLRGNAGAGGAMLACACDVTVAHPSVMLTPTYKSMHLYGSEYWTYFFPRKVGHRKATELTSSTDSILAPEAMAIGLVDDVLGDSRSEFCDLYPQYVQQMADSGLASRIIQQKMAERTPDWFQTIKEHRDQELIRMWDNFRSPKFHDAMKKFVYKIQDTDPNSTGQKQ